ncbi:hypothetical protein D3C76_634120 [compost metagenome]
MKLQSCRLQFMRLQVTESQEYNQGLLSILRAKVANVQFFHSKCNDFIKKPANMQVFQHFPPKTKDHVKNTCKFAGIFLDATLMRQKDAHLQKFVANNPQKSLKIHRLA